MPAKRREKQVYVETYKSPGLPLKGEYLPVFKHLSTSYKLVEVNLLKAGVVERDGKRLELQELRLYLEVVDEKPQG